MLISIMDTPIYTSATINKYSSFPMPSGFYFHFFSKYKTFWQRWVLSIFISLKSKGVEDFCICLLAICISFFENSLFSFSPIFIELFAFLYRFLSFLYILDILTNDQNIFSFQIGWFFRQLTAVEKLLHFVFPFVNNWQ